MENLKELIDEIAPTLGASAVGIVSTDTLKGGPPSTDLTYVLPGAKSAICFALPLNQNYIEPYLKKENHTSHNRDNMKVNIMASGLALEISNFLNMKGNKSVPIASNLVYRTDTENGPLDEVPPISHRYLAVRSGIGHFGLSGNVITKKEGAAIILASVVTEAELEPTDALPDEDNYCDNCRLCQSVCASGFMSKDEEINITMGGKQFSYSKRLHHNRCDYVCGGFTGLSKSGKWSTWSPARFPIPDRDEEFLNAIIKSAGAYARRPRDTAFFHFLIPGHKTEFTCGNCMLVCHPDKEVRKKRHSMFINSGVVIEYKDGTRKAVSPEDAKKYLATLDPETRALYEKV